MYSLNSHYGYAQSKRNHILQRREAAVVTLLLSSYHPIPVLWEKWKDQDSGKGSSVQTTLDTFSEADRIDQHYFRFLKKFTILKVFEHFASILMGEAVQLVDQLL